MGERKGTNKYYPPDFDPQKHRNLAGYTGQHPLRERARKLHLGILIIRFEMPYNIWCDGCNNHIGMGVRYNAEKSKVGMYYTTPIYKFRMKCHLCDNHFEIKTDPANHDYVIISGARRKEQRWDPKENEQIVPEDRDNQKKLATDAMFKLEHGVQDQGKAKETKSNLALIADAQSGWKDDFALNQLARNKFRNEKNATRKTHEEDLALLKKSSLNVPLVKEHEDDVRMAQLIKYSTNTNYDLKQKQKRQAIQSRPLFGQVSKSSSSKPESAKERTLTNVRKLVSSNKPQLGDSFDASSPKQSTLSSISGIVIKRTAQTETSVSEESTNKLETTDQRESNGSEEGSNVMAGRLGSLCDYDSSSSGGAD